MGRSRTQSWHQNDTRVLSIAETQTDCRILHSQLEFQSTRTHLPLGANDSTSAAVLVLKLRALFPTLSMVLRQAYHCPPAKLVLACSDNNHRHTKEKSA